MAPVPATAAPSSLERQPEPHRAPGRHVRHPVPALVITDIV
ncbi:hypothetical protein [Streptomyces collinus]